MGRSLITVLVFIALATAFAIGVGQVLFPKDPVLPTFPGPVPTPTPLPWWPDHHGVELDSP